MLEPWPSSDGTGVSDGPVASVLVQAVVSRTRDNEAIASQVEARRAMGGTLRWDESGQGYRQCGATHPADLGPFCDN